MKISIEQTKYYKYKIEFEDSPFEEALSFMHYLQSQFTWQEISYADKSWHFTKPILIDIIKSKYPEVVIDPNVHLDAEEIELNNKKTELTNKKVEEIKTATTSNLKIKGIKGTLYDFQKLAVEAIQISNGKMILASEMGVGKTVQSLAYITTNNLKKILVITPASLKWNWHEEINKFTKLKATVINSKSGLSIELYNDHNIIIINYDILKKFYQELSSLRFDVCICDEAHYLKGRSQRFKFTKTIAKSISKLLLLTGTPLLNRPVDLFNLLNLIDPFTWSNWFSYTQKYCNGFRDKWGYNANGCSNIEELREKISKYFFRQTKKEVLKELPDKTFIDIPIDLPAKIQSEYDMILESFSDYLKDIKNKTDSEIKKTMQAEKLVRLNELRQKASEGKIKSAEEIINNVLDNGEKIVVFSAYNLPLITLKESFLDKSVIIIGNTPELERKKAVNEFQNNDKIKIFFGGMLSASVGLTLTAANNVLFLDYPWRPSDRSQAYSRIERIGQTKRMNIMQLIARNTIDQQMRTLLNKKQELFDKLIENENVVNEKMSNESLANSLIKNIETS